MFMRGEELRHIIAILIIIDFKRCNFCHAITDAEPEPTPPVRNVGRRKSVFAEAYNPEDDADDQPAVRKSLRSSCH